MFDALTFFTRHKIIRYLMAGGTGATVHLGLVFILTHVLDVWYLYATSIGFVTALGISFTLQKFWTFQNSSTNHIQTQGITFVLVAVVNFMANGLLMRFFVEYAELVPVIAQAVTSALIAVEAFVVYSIIFRTRQVCS